MTIDVLLRVEAVHLDEQLVQRLLALVVAAAEAGEALPPDRVDLVDEDDRRRGVLAPCSNRSRTRLAPTPTNISTNSEPLTLKNGTPASPATALASSVLPVPGGPTSSMPRGKRAPSWWYFAGILEEVDDLGQLLLRLLLTRDIGEGDMRALRVVDVAPERAEAEDVLLPARQLPPDQNDQADEERQGQQADEEIEQQRHEAAAVCSLDVHLHVLLLQERQERRILHDGQARLEVRDGLGRRGGRVAARRSRRDRRRSGGDARPADDATVLDLHGLFERAQ